MLSMDRTVRRHKSEQLLVRGVQFVTAGIFGAIITLWLLGYPLNAEPPTFPKPATVSTQAEYPEPGLQAITYYTADGDKCRLFLQEDQLKVAICAWRGELELAAMNARRAEYQGNTASTAVNSTAN